MLNTFQPGSVVAPHLHLDIGEICVCIYGCFIDTIIVRKNGKRNPLLLQLRVNVLVFLFQLGSIILWRHLAK